MKVKNLSPSRNLGFLIDYSMVKQNNSLLSINYVLFLRKNEQKSVLISFKCKILSRLCWELGQHLLVWLRRFVLCPWYGEQAVHGAGVPRVLDGAWGLLQGPGRGPGGLWDPSGDGLHHPVHGGQVPRRPLPIQLGHRPCLIIQIQRCDLFIDTNRFFSSYTSSKNALVCLYISPSVKSWIETRTLFLNLH